MRIGELSRLTETPSRLLRYYEAQGLIHPDRLANGYRSYEVSTIDRVRQIRGLIDSGLPTEIIREVLPCLDGPHEIHFSVASHEMVQKLSTHRDKMTVRIDCLVRNRDAIAAYIGVVERGLPSDADGDEAA